METVDIDKKVREEHERLKAEFHNQMNGWKFFRDLDDFAKNMTVLEMVDKYQEGKRSGWLEGFSKRA